MAEQRQAFHQGMAQHQALMAWDRLMLQELQARSVQWEQDGPAAAAAVAGAGSPAARVANAAGPATAGASCPEAAAAGAGGPAAKA